MLQASQHVEQTTPCIQAATFWDWVWTLCPSFVEPALLASCKATLSRCPVEQAGFTLLADQVLGRGATTISLQLGLVAEDCSLTLLQIHFEHDGPLDASKLFGPWNSRSVKGDIALSVHRLQLSEERYGPLRMAFAMTLRDRRESLICPLLAAEHAA